MTRYSLLTSAQKSALHHMIQAGDKAAVAALKVAKSLDRVHRDNERRELRARAPELVAAYTKPVVVVRPGKARGHGELNRKAARALPMQYLVVASSR